MWRLINWIRFVGGVLAFVGVGLAADAVLRQGERYPGEHVLLSQLLASLAFAWVATPRPAKKGKP